MIYRRSARRARARADAREKILRAAGKLLARRGYENTTMQDIVTAARTSIGNVYFYFENKEALVGSLLEEAATAAWEWTDRAAASVPPGPARLALMVMANAVGMLEGNAPLTRLLLLNESTAKLRERVHARFAARIRSYILANMPDFPTDRIDVAVTAWIGAARTCLEEKLAGRLAGDARELSQFLVRWNLRGLGVPEGEIDEAIAVAVRVVAGWDGTARVGRRATSRAVRAGVVLSLVAHNLAAQPANAFVPSRCVRDTTIALTMEARVSTVDTVAPGIHYQCLYAPHGPWAIHVASIDLATARYAVDGARALGAMLGREKVSDMAQRLRARGDTPVVAINADFFDLRTGEVASNAVIRGEWVKGVVIPDAPHAEFDNARTQFAVDDRSRPLIGRFELHGELRAGVVRERLLGINERSPRDSGLVLYTPWFGERTPADSARRDVVELTLDRMQGGSQGVYRVRRRSLTRGGGSAIPRRGAVLRANGRGGAILRRLQDKGGTVRITTQLGTHPTPPRTVVGGWARLVVDGRNIGGIADSLEGTRPSFSSARHPRSAIGVSRDSSTLMLVVVDGRRPWSVGMSLAELGDQLIALGAYQAMNLDGGGSSTLWVRGTIVNYPSDPTGERPVGNALMIVPRR